MTTPHMARALELAGLVEGFTSPNPPVGAVLVRDGAAVGEGNTQPPGGPHAEIVALRSAGERARRASLFVTLEPCSHWGRTPPCADALLEAGVAAVHAAVLDPNPLVRGSGIGRLKAHGVEIVVGDGADEASRLIAPHTRYTTAGAPLVTVFHSGPVEVLERLVHTTDVVVSEVDPPNPAWGRAMRATHRRPRSRVVKVGRVPAVVTDMRSGTAESAARPRSLPMTVWDWSALIMELARRETTAVLLPGSGEPAGSMLRQRLVDRIVAHSSFGLPAGFRARADESGDGSYVVAYRDDDHS